jgi:hypothetical protein
MSRSDAQTDITSVHPEHVGIAVRDPGTKHPDGGNQDYPARQRGKSGTLFDKWALWLLKITYPKIALWQRCVGMRLLRESGNEGLGGRKTAGNVRLRFSPRWPNPLVAVLVFLQNMVDGEWALWENRPLCSWE